MTTDQMKFFEAVMLATLEGSVLEMEITPEQLKKVDMVRFSNLVADRFTEIYNGNTDV